MDEFEKRLKAAKAERDKRVEQDGFEVYKYCFNGREDEWLTPGKNNREPEEIFTDTVANIASDFSGELFHTMTPENSPWVEYEAGAAVAEEFEADALDLIKRREIAISKAIKASNYYDEGPSAFQDANFGTVALWIEPQGFGLPANVEAVPASEIYIRQGPRGIEDRFRKRRYQYSDLPVLFPDADFPREIQDAIKKGTKSAEVVWGFWRDYKDPAAPRWRQAIRVDRKPIGLDIELGFEGSCPMLVGRFGAVPGRAWGVGPARRNLATLRVLDELVRMNLEAMDHNLDPAIVYPNDGVLDLSDGLEAGMAYPAMPGSADSITPIYGGQLDYGFFTEERIEERIRDAFYREMMQRGKTPPSASQYVGETQKQIRRMARPAGKLWTEIGVGLLQRFEWLETQPGGSLAEEDMGAITVNQNIVTLRPVSPLERAQASEDMMMAQSLMEMVATNLGPEQAAMLVDGPATMRNMKKTAKDEIVQFRSEEQIMQILAMQQGVQGEPEG